MQKHRNERTRRQQKWRKSQLKESPTKEVEVVWTCEAKTGALRRKEDDGNGIPMEEEERKA